jgi:hypothetical protein
MRPSNRDPSMSSEGEERQLETLGGMKFDLLLTDGDFRLTLLGETNDSGVQATNLREFHFADVAEFVAEVLPRPG